LVILSSFLLLGDGLAVPCWQPSAFFGLLLRAGLLGSDGRGAVAGAAGGFFPADKTAAELLASAFGKGFWVTPEDCVGAVLEEGRPAWPLLLLFISTPRPAPLPC
jgi:hypothetical protein